MSCYMYKVIDGELVAKIFDDDTEEGWYDSPKAAKAVKVKESPKAVKKPKSDK